MTKSNQPPTGAVLKAETFAHYVEGFNAADDERYVQAIPNAAAWEFLAVNIPLFECPERTIEQTYYFRWWTFRKHLREVDGGAVITEFLAPVRHAGVHNTISCALGHHLLEGRWLAEPRWVDETVRFWLRGNGGKPQPHLHQYSSWLAQAMWWRYCADGRGEVLGDYLDDLVADYRLWEAERLGADGLFWQYDVRDGMEESISGSRTARNARPSINSYMYGNARAIAAAADLVGREELAAEFGDNAEVLKRLIQGRLWDAEAAFFKTRLEGDGLADVRELIGYTPWYVHLPDGGYEAAWAELTDEEGFAAPFGLTTAEQRHPRFAIAYEGDACQWNGPSWPFATAITLTAMANVLNDYAQDVLSASDYFAVLRTYAASHRLTRGDGVTVPWIDENLNPFTGEWLARERKRAKAAARDETGTFAERGKDYNHSTFCDLVITGLVGLRPQPGAKVTVRPLAPSGWDYFCLDRVPYHGRMLTILWDRAGQRYNRGRGLVVLGDGRELARGETLAPLTATLPS